MQNIATSRGEIPRSELSAALEGEVNSFKGTQFPLSVLAFRADITVLFLASTAGIRFAFCKTFVYTNRHWKKNCD